LKWGPKGKGIGKNWGKFLQLEEKFGGITSKIILNLIIQK